MMLCFAALGAGNGALFQLVPLRWPTTTAVAGSMIGEIGALGGGLLPNVMGQSKQLTDTYLWGFASFAVLALIAAGGPDPMDPHLGREGRARARAALIDTHVGQRLTNPANHRSRRGGSRTIHSRTCGVLPGAARATGGRPL
jgi:hypothetical protein